MSADVQIREALITASDLDVDLGSLLGNVQRRARSKRRRRRNLVAVATCLTLLLAAGTVALVSNGSDGRGPAVSVRPANAPTQAQDAAAVPWLLPDASMTIDDITIGGKPISPPQPAQYVQVFAASPTFDGARLVIETTEIAGGDSIASTCGATTDARGGPVNKSTPVQIGDHDACVVFNYDGPAIDWDDSDGVRVTVHGTGLSYDELVSVANGVVRRTGEAEGVTINGALPARLAEIVSGPFPPHRPTWVIFHQGACRYALQVGQENAFWFSYGGTPTTVNGHTALLRDNSLTWNPADEASAWLTVNEDGLAAGPSDQVVRDCDPVGTASRLAQVDSATWQQALTALGDKVHQPG
jgi:hypothetical protein